MFHKVKSVSAQPDGRTLLVQFAHGETKQYDVTENCAQWSAFRALADPLLWQQVQADAGGYGVSWSDELDLSCDELYSRGQPVHTPFDGLLSFGDASQLWGLNESTLRKAIFYGKLRSGFDAQKFGKQWVISEKALRREYGKPKDEA